MLFLPDDLARLGWCTNHQMNSRIVYNKKEKDKFEKIQISEFYWFNYSASEKVCDCFIALVLRTQNKKCLLEEWQVRLVIFFIYFNFIETFVEILKIK